MFESNTRSIVIAKRADEEPLKLDEDELRQWSEESDIQASRAMQMFAVLLLMLIVAGAAGLFGFIAWLIQRI